MSYKKFIPRSSLLNSSLDKIDIKSNGAIVFNINMVKTHKMDGFNYAILFFDIQAKCIGIKLTKSRSKDTVKLSKKPNRTVSLLCGSLLRYYEIDYRKDAKNIYNFKHDKRRKMFIIDLNLKY